MNALDLFLLKQSFGSTPASFNWNAVCDLNTDQIINVLDLEILANTLAKLFKDFNR